MAKTVVVCGYGPGISDAVAKKFGGEGFSVALVSRSSDKLRSAADALGKQGIRAAAFATDLADASAVEALIARVRAELGPVTVLHWNAYASSAGDLTTATASEIRAALDVSAVNLAVAVRAALPDLEKQSDAALLVTGGGFALYESNVDALAVEWNSMGIALGKAAQHKLVGLLAAKLKEKGIFVGEVMVLGIVKGTRFDSGTNATLEAAQVADAFWQQYRNRTESFASITGTR